MTEVRGVWEFAMGGEPPPEAAIKVNPLFCAYEYTSEAQSKTAWKMGWDVGSNVSLWRMALPDMSAFQIICMGESMPKVHKVERVLVKCGGKVWVPERGMVRALALRRYGTAIEEAAKGNTEHVTVVNRWAEQGGMRLGHDGKMTPHVPDA